jgi:hypothetical protein
MVEAVTQQLLDMGVVQGVIRLASGTPKPNEPELPEAAQVVRDCGLRNAGHLRKLPHV